MVMGTVVCYFEEVYMIMKMDEPRLAQFDCISIIILLKSICFFLTI